MISERSCDTEDFNKDADNLNMKNIYVLIK